MATAVKAKAPAQRGSRGFSVRRLEPWIGPPWVWGLLLATLLVASILAPDFAQSTNFTTILQQGVPLAVVAIGETLVILTGGIDISVAVTISLGDTLAMGIMNGQNGNVWRAIILTLLAGAAVGLVNGTVVAKARVPAFIVTLGTASVLQGIIFAYTGSSTYGIPSDAVVNLGFDYWGPLPALVVLFIPLLVVALFVQNRTRAGRHLYAVGGNEASARLAGINVDRVKIAAYVLCSMLAALAGIVLTTRTGGGEPLAGTGFDWDAIAAVVIGGTALRGGKGGIAGTVVAVVILSVVDNAMNLMNITTFWQSAVKGAIVLSAVIAAALAALKPLEVLRLWRERGRAGVE